MTKIELTIASNEKISEKSTKASSIATATGYHSEKKDVKGLKMLYPQR